MTPEIICAEIEAIVDCYEEDRRRNFDQAEDFLLFNFQDLYADLTATLQVGG